MKRTQTSLPILIIGNGIAGITAARHIRKNSNQRIVVISKESDYFFSRTALMYVFMGHMKWEHIEPYEKSFWKKNKIELIQDEVCSIDAKSKSIRLKSNDIYSYDSLILAVGSTPNLFGWKGQELNGVQGLYSKQDLEKLDKWSSTSRKAVIVGGGLIGVELAEMLHSRGIHVSFLVRESSFCGNVFPKGESELIGKHILAHGIDLRYNTNLVEILSDDNGRARGVITDKGEQIDCELVGLTAGVRPNIDFLKDTELEIGRGILVDSMLQTNLEDVYAIGDCAELKTPQPHRRSIEAVWYSGRMMGETIAETLTKKPTPYLPGNWFNSAKFFDIEYQTYGQVTAEPNSDELQFYWELNEKNCAIRIAYKKENNQFIGINSFGIRLRHVEIDNWLTQKIKVDEAIEKLSTAFFDPEFYPNYHKQIKSAWKQYQN